MKNILFVIDSLYCGGAEKSLVTLLNNLNYKKYQVSLIINTKGGEFEKFVPNSVNIIFNNSFSDINKFEILILRIKYFFARKSDFKKKKHLSQHFWNTFKKKIKSKDIKYDVAIAYGQGFSTYYVAEKIRAQFKYAWLNTDHQKAGYNPQFDYDRYSNFNKIIAVSNESKRSLENAMNNLNKTLPIEVIRDIVDKDFIKKLSSEGTGFEDRSFDGIKILTVCRLERVKGLDLALEACSILLRKKIKFKWYVIGNGSLYKSLEKLIIEKKLQDHFILLGFRENPYSYMKECDIYVQTSRFEGLGMTVIEASFLNVPIVTTNFPTASTIIRHKETGLICDINSKSITNNILNYLENPSLTHNIIKNMSLEVNTDKERSLQEFNDLIEFS